ncbi:hypothetical protein RJ55_07838 [Drechmeria coniospora]|nr:hypothetical protein RJ55_07838 [Drechmeria coniospora]
MASLDFFLGSLLFLVPLLHLLVSPHTKVEESFNMQATHDILVYGTPLSSPGDRFASTYDHFTFPGVVPRTFLGAVMLSGISQPFTWLAGFEHAQFIVRAILGSFNALCLLVFRSGLANSYGRGVANLWAVMIVTQFHVVYYATRTLPNMFAFGLSTLAFAFLLPRSDPRQGRVRLKQAIGLLVFATAIFRSELAIFLAVLGLEFLVSKRMTLRELVTTFLGSFVAALAMSIPVDSYFWQKPVWPELWGFYYNAILGSSSDWGVSPWHYYFTSALPRLLLSVSSIPLIMLALWLPGTSRQARPLVLPSLLYIAIYSFQPHKEARFIFYVIPPLTGAAALGANYIFARESKSSFYTFGKLCITLSIMASAAGSVAMLLLSSLSYPGGDAVAQLFAIANADPTAFVHADVLTCMTGLTRFGQNPIGLPLTQGARESSPEIAAAAGPVLLFDKTEDRPKLGRSSFWNTMDYALMEDSMLPLGNWRTIGVIQAFSGIQVLKPGVDDPEVAEEGQRAPPKVLGLGATVATIRTTVRRFTGGWWIGPRMSPRIHIMKRVQEVRYATS